MLVLPHPLQQSTERHPLFTERRPLFAESHPLFTAAAMGGSIDRIRRAPGISTAARPGSPRQQRHERSYSNTPLAAPWVNNDSTTSVRVEGSHPPAAAQFLTREAGDIAERASELLSGAYLFDTTTPSMHR